MLAGECNKIYTRSIINRSFNSHEPKIINSLLVAPPCPALLYAMSRDTAWEEMMSDELMLVNKNKFSIFNYQYSMFNGSFRRCWCLAKRHQHLSLR
jgi:hypothetical protein